jgi:hypothetical protein
MKPHRGHLCDALCNLVTTGLPRRNIRDFLLRERSAHEFVHALDHFPGVFHEAGGDERVVDELAGHFLGGFRLGGLGGGRRLNLIQER